MALSNITGSIAASYNIKVTDDNFNNPTFIANAPVNQAYSFGTGAGQVDLIYSAETTVGGGGNLQIVLDNGSITDVFGNTISFVTIKSIRVQHAADSASSSVSLTGSFFDNEFTSLLFNQALLPGSLYLISQASTGYGVGAAENIIIDNNDGSNGAVFTVEILGTSV